MARTHICGAARRHCSCSVAARALPLGVGVKNRRGGRTFGAEMRYAGLIICLSVSVVCYDLPAYGTAQTSSPIKLGCHWKKTVTFIHPKINEVLTGPSSESGQTYFVIDLEKTTISDGTSIYTTYTKDDTVSRITITDDKISFTYNYNDSILQTINIDRHTGSYSERESTLGGPTEVVESKQGDCALVTKNKF
jgi:hypothetical protein